MGVASTSALAHTILTKKRAGAMFEMLGVVLLIVLLTPIVLSTLVGLALVGIAVAGRSAGKAEAASMGHSHTG
jgi:hypothetical protein